MVDGTTAALTPSAVSLAATWDINVVAGIGHLLADEVKDKRADILLAPTGNFYPFSCFGGDEGWVIWCGAVCAGGLEIHFFRGWLGVSSGALTILDPARGKPAVYQADIITLM